MFSFPLYQVDAFAETLFRGNPAASCFLPEWPNDKIMQSIAAENNLAETAFLVTNGSGYDIRWFTPLTEVDLCGHATLASAYVLFKCLNYPGNEVVFHSPRSGELRVSRQGEMLFLDFPTDVLTDGDYKLDIETATGMRPVATWKGKTDIIALFENEKQIRTMQPKLKEIAKLPCRGVIVTAPGDEVDFVSRFFAPQSGIDEDPVTGSAHTSLTPIWSNRLKKTTMTALQLSARGGKLQCTFLGDRCKIGGYAQLYLTGTIFLDQ
ncbi:MAG: PhzF family phenazine biosynthesis protein [Bacteroidetes bacterium]|nr:PhzF family phenazine biosynthesis protein [Bacteroidota bacterium]